ncbi:pyridoxamine 5'-phosphate oxidase [Dickeya fangzhongdai]|uniref:pyridoxamine 5'-phosphate oxidase n=1 Tax=Dickeya fangzhongdai TaxID=1778540 RepID=UPI0033078D41
MTTEHDDAHTPDTRNRVAIAPGENIASGENIAAIDIADLRREYTRGGLRRHDLTDNPLDLFERWLKQACEAQLADPTAMCVATVDEQGQPYQRIVLLKHYDEKGMVFYTNMGSRKAQQLAVNSRISLLFPWHMLERQVIVLGKAEKLPMLDVMKYFHSRPRDSQIGAWVSKQSSRISARSMLESKFFEMKQKFQQGEIPLPSFWGGFRVTIESMEFWQGGEHRLHDRFLYQRESDGWTIERLAP